MSTITISSIFETYETYKDFCDSKIIEYIGSNEYATTLNLYIYLPVYLRYVNTPIKFDSGDAFMRNFSNQLVEVAFDFHNYAKENIEYFEYQNDTTKQGKPMSKTITTGIAPINQTINQSVDSTNLASGTGSQFMSETVYNGIAWHKLVEGYFTPNRKTTLLKAFQWLFVSVYSDTDIYEIDETYTFDLLGKRITATNGTLPYTYVNNRVEDTQNYAFYNDKNIVSFTANNLGNIRSSMFYTCSNLKEVECKNATTIMASAFYTCGKLEKVTLPNVTTLTPSSSTHSYFINCSAIKQVLLPKLLATIDVGKTTFRGCTNLEVVDLGKAKSIGDTCFYGCTKLTDIYLRRTASDGGVATIASNAFSNTPSTMNHIKIHVPSDLITDYQNETNWSTYYSSEKVVFVPLEE